MYHVLGILLLLRCCLAEIDWNLSKSKRCKEFNFHCSSVYMTTKFDYDASDNQSMAIFVKKIVKKNVQKANIKRVIIALSGGPGQTTRDMEPFVFSQWNDNSIMDDSVFVCADHRFTGKSGRYKILFIK